MPERESMTDRDTGRAAADEPECRAARPARSVSSGGPAESTSASEPAPEFAPVIGSVQPAAITVGAADRSPVLGAGALGAPVARRGIGDRVLLRPDRRAPACS